MAPRAIWRRAAELGFLCPRVPSAYGGADADFLYSVILLEEQARVRRDRAGDVAAQRRRRALHRALRHRGAEAAAFCRAWRPASASAPSRMTEPGAGSDLQGDRDDRAAAMATTIVHPRAEDVHHQRPLRRLDHRRGQDRCEGGARAASASSCSKPPNAKGFLARAHSRQARSEGVGHGRALLRRRSRCPHRPCSAATEGRGFAQLMDRLVEERLMTAVAAIGFIDRAIEITVAVHARAQSLRTARARLSEHALPSRRGQDGSGGAARLPRTLHRASSCAGELDAPTAAALKWWATEQQCSIVDDCVQLHGGYGYILDYPIARMWLDSRIAKIYGGSNEIMKEIIGRSL